MTTPAPASVEAAARAWTDEHVDGRECRLPGGRSFYVPMESKCVEAFKAGHAAAWPDAYADGHEDGYKRGCAESSAARDGELQAARELADAALEALRDITLSGISFDDERLKYIEVQIDRDDWMAALRVVKDAANDPQGA